MDQDAVIQQQMLQAMQMQQQQTHHQPTMNPQQREDTAALNFLAMAEYFRTCKPPCYKAAAKCLIASTKTNASILIRGHCYYQLGKFLYYYTRNLSVAKEHLTTAHQIFKELGNHLEELRLKTACLIAECALALQETDCILPLLKSEAPYTRKHPNLHGKALMLTIEALSMMDTNMALEVANMGLRYFNDLNDTVMECYFQLVKSLLYSRMPGQDSQLSEAVNGFSNIVKTHPSIQNFNDMSAFCYTIQLSYFLTVGMVGNAKKCLKQLQLTVQEKSREAQIEPAFHWMRKELLTSLAYVMTAICSIQCGDFGKAIKYHEVSRNHLNELNVQMKKPEWGVIGRGYERLSAHLHFALHDAMSQMYLARAMPEKVFDNTTEMVKALRVVPKDLRLFEGQVHLLMGMYFQYMNFTEEAEQQLIAVQSTTDDCEVAIMAKLCLALLYLFQERETDFYNVFEPVRYTKIENASSTCQVVSQFVDAVHSYVHKKPECKNLAADAVKICQDRDILRVQAMGMLLICKLFNCTDTDTVAVSKQMAKNTNDPALQAWAFRCIIEHYEGRIEIEPNVRTDMDSYMKQLKDVEQQMAEGKQKALEQMFPKFATMTNFTTELASNWRGNLY